MKSYVLGQLKKCRQRENFKSLAGPLTHFQLTRKVTQSLTRSSTQTRTWIQTRASFTTDINLSGFFLLYRLYPK